MKLCCLFCCKCRVKLCEIYYTVVPLFRFLLHGRYCAQQGSDLERCIWKNTKYVQNLNGLITANAIKMVMMHNETD